MWNCGYGVRFFASLGRLKSFNSESASSSGSKSDFCELKLNFVPDSGSLSDALHPSTK